MKTKHIKAKGTLRHKGALHRYTAFACGSAGKESACNVGDLGSIPGLGRSPGEGKGFPLQYSGLENSMGCIVHGVTKSLTQMSDFHFLSSVHLYTAQIRKDNSPTNEVLLFPLELKSSRSSQ